MGLTAPGDLDQNVFKVEAWFFSVASGWEAFKFNAGVKAGTGFRDEYQSTRFDCFTDRSLTGAQSPCGLVLAVLIDKFVEKDGRHGLT